MWPPDGRLALLAVSGCALLLATGCGQGTADGPGFPVTGKVTVEGEPLKSGVVLYVPDVQRGNRSRVRPAGPIDEEGSYTLSAEGKRNIPPGWYIVVVQAFEPSPKGAKSTRSLRNRGRPLVNQAYGTAATSDLRVEVRGNAGPEDYDLRLRR
jgi:hypothetical protein